MRANDTDSYWLIMIFCPLNLNNFQFCTKENDYKNLLGFLASSKTQFRMGIRTTDLKARCKKPVCFLNCDIK